MRRSMNADTRPSSELSFGRGSRDRGREAKEKWA
jgi:hypothetical protein